VSIDTVLYTGTDATTPVVYSAAQFRLGAGAVYARGGDGTNALRARAGVLTAGSFKVTQTATASMTVNIANGFAAVQGTADTQGVYTAVALAATTITLDPSDAGAARFDLIALRVFDIDDGTVVAGGPHYGGQVVKITGTPSGAPVVPTVPVDAIPLAAVLVGAGVSAVTDAQITDFRARTVAVGGVLPVTSTTRPFHQLGLVIYETDTGAVYISDGANWRDPRNVLAVANATDLGKHVQMGTTTASIASGQNAGSKVVAFTAGHATIPLVFAQHDTVAGGVNGNFGVRVTARTTGGFTATVYRTDGSNAPSAQTVGFSWISYG